MTPSFMGLMATMLPGVRPSISLASLPTASTSPLFLLIATMEGSFTTIPLPRAYTSVFAVPRSMARSLENMLARERILLNHEPFLWKPLDDDINVSSFQNLGSRGQRGAAGDGDCAGHPARKTCFRMRYSGF